MKIENPFAQTEKGLNAIVVGLPQVGKTTLVEKMKISSHTGLTVPAIGFNVESVDYKKTHFSIWSLGNEKFRPLYQYYFHKQVDAIIFVVDSTDRKSIADACEELKYLLAQPELQNSALLVFANMQDKFDPMSISEVTDKLQLSELKSHKWFVQSLSLRTGDGMFEGFEWLSSCVQGV